MPGLEITYSSFSSRSGALDLTIHHKEYLFGKAYFLFMVEPDLGAIILKKLDSIEWDY